MTIPNSQSLYWCEIIVDVRFFSRRELKFSGTGLLILLVVSLSLSALVFDNYGSQIPFWSVSLSLPLLTCAVIAAVLGYWVIPVLQRLKAGQVIQEDGLQSHFRKAGTPTMGGIFFIPVAIVLACWWSEFAPEVITVCSLTLFYGLIGWLDDWKILQRQSNKGISPRTKLILQVSGAALFCLWISLTQSENITNIQLPLGIVLPLGLLFFPLAVFVLVAESNATNLTDGVDGLAAGTGAITALGLGMLIAPTSPSLAIFCACLSGSCLGFIVHNRNPAAVFMGDTGSLAIGGALAAVGILSGYLWTLFIISGIFFIESLSVIAQVSYYKATKGPDGKGKRLLRMAPLHHHLELIGWKENKIVGVFYLINFVLVVLAWLTSR